MNLIHDTIINVLSIIILLIIGSHLLKSDEKDNLQYRLYLSLLIANIGILILDIMGRFDGNPDTYFPIVNQLGNFLLFSLLLVVPSLWLMYTYLHVFRDEKKTMKLLPPLLILNALNVVTVIFNNFFHFYYYIDSDNIYRRGELFSVSFMIPIGILIGSIGLLLAKRKWISKTQLIPLILFPVSPIIGSIIQAVIYGVSLQFTSTVIALLMIFLNIQNEQIHTDYLTGLHNRKRLDDYLRKMVSASPKDLSIIIIDVDHFKAINDTYGHKTGDKILRDVAKLLTASVNNRNFVARYGGDEFCVVLDECNLEQLKRIVSTIKNNVENYNLVHDHTVQLGLSMGYAVYDHSGLNAEEFFHYADSLMYLDKQTKVQTVNVR